MNNYLLVACAASITAIAGYANAALISTNGSLSSEGVAAEIIDAPTFVLDDNVFNRGIQAFDEAQGIYLTEDITFDSGTFGKGLKVDSHMIFLNSRAQQRPESYIEHGFGTSPTASFTFDGMILGVMSNYNGSLEINTSDFLGADGTTYPTEAFAARGMENNPLVGTEDDYYSFAGATIFVGMRVTEPGDWIRVVTVTSVPVPASALMLGTALAGAGGISAMRRRKKQTQ